MRREPSFASPRNPEAKGQDFRLNPEDRPRSPLKPTEKPQRVKAVAERARRASAKSKARNKPRSRKEGRGRRSLVGRLFVWGFTLGVWGVIVLAGLVGYYFTKLPPIDQLAVPKRAPNVAILASDGSLIANRGETGGRTVTLSELPAYAPKAFVAIEDRRFYSHLGIDPIGLARALAVTAWRRGHGGLQGGSTLTQQL
ncbi:MAG: transglycosylase domain-containing protein, partial [Hyphomicrobiales bacterium]|nr:transglycosylase domain-containing protein [Hyphomicrobiales bacterium]